MEPIRPEDKREDESSKAGEEVPVNERAELQAVGEDDEDEDPVVKKARIATEEAYEAVREALDEEEKDDKGEDAAQKEKGGLEPDEKGRGAKPMYDPEEILENYGFNCWKLKKYDLM